MKNLKFLIIAFFAMFSLSAFADDIDEAEAYKALMKQQLLSQQHAAQQALQANTIESFQAAKIARLKAQLGSQGQQPQVVYVPQQSAPLTQQQAQQQALPSPYAYRGQPYNIHPLQPMTPLQRSVIPDSPQQQLIPDYQLPPTVQESLNDGEEELTPEQAAQEKYEQEHSSAPPVIVDPADDPLGLKPIMYRQRITKSIQVRYMRPGDYRQPRMQQIVYTQKPQQRVVYQQPNVQRVVYLGR